MFASFSALRDLLHDRFSDELASVRPALLGEGFELLLGQSEGDELGSRIIGFLICHFWLLS